MAKENKRYYWLKFQKDFFKRHDIQIIEAMENGKDYVLFYLKIMLESIAHNGKLRFSDTIPYNDRMLSVITNTNLDIVRAALKIFEELKIIELLDDKTLYLTEVEKLIGSETASTRRSQKSREQKALQCNTSATKCNENATQSKSKSKSKEIDTELNQEYQTSVYKKKDRILKENKANIKNIQIDKTDNIILNNINKEDFTTDFYDTIDTIDHNNDDVSLYAYGGYQNVMLTMAQVDSLELDYGAKMAEKYIEKASKFIKFKAPNIKKSHYEMIKKWIDEDNAI
ncbi:MAG: phage replisome organizer N-terminal domain-containing protein [Candidatus Fimenecus sp.]